MDTAVFPSVATQLMTSDKVMLGDKRLPIRRLKSVSFSIEGREQNAEKPSRWGRSRRGAVYKFIAVAVDGQAKEYGAMASASTPAPSSVRRTSFPRLVTPGHRSRRDYLSP